MFSNNARIYFDLFNNHLLMGLNALIPFLKNQANHLLFFCDCLSCVLNSFPLSILNILKYRLRLPAIKSLIKQNPQRKAKINDKKMIILLKISIFLPPHELQIYNQKRCQFTLEYLLKFRIYQMDLFEKADKQHIFYSFFHTKKTQHH